MTARPDEFEIRRVRVALETSGDGTRSLGPAVAVAARLKAAIEGLLVAERNVASLVPGTAARYVSRLPSEPVDFPDLAAELRGAMAMIEAALKADAARLGLSWSLQMVGDLIDEAFADMFDPRDLLITAANSRLLAALGPECATLAAFASAMPCSVLILPGTIVPRRPFVFATTQTEPTWRALSAAIQFTGASERSVDIGLVGTGADEKTARTIRSWLAQRGFEARFAPSIPASRAPLVRVAAPPGHELIILPAALTELKDIDLSEFCRQIRAPLLIVR